MEALDLGQTHFDLMDPDDLIEVMRQVRNAKHLYLLYQIVTGLKPSYEERAREVLREMGA